MAKTSLKKATVIYAAAKYSTIIIQLFISAILSRILSPSDYGVVAIVNVFTTLFSTLANMGLGTAVTQYQDLTKQDTQDIFTFSEYVAIALTVIFALMAYPIALFYDDMVYFPVMLVLTLSVFFNAMNMVPSAILMKEKKFLLVGVRMIVATAVSGVVAIILSLVGFAYYALVIQSILSGGIQFIWNMKGSGLKFKLKFNYAPIKRVQGYSSNQFIYNICLYLVQNLDNLLTGKILGSEALAYYNKAYTLMRYPVTNLAHVITPVLHPVLAEHQDSKRYIYNEFIKVIKVMSLLGAFLTVFCFWADTEIIICYFGNQWYDAVAPFKWLSICIGVQMMNAIFGSIYQSLGCTKQMLRSGMFHMTISLLAIIAGSYTKNISLLALFVSLSMIIKFFIESYFLIKRCFGYSIFAFLKNFIPDVIIIAVMALVVFAVGDLSNMNIWISLIIKLVISGIVFLILLVITKQKNYLTALLPKKFRGHKLIRKGKND